ncbi:hypothetical protein HN682_05920 [Candidatus Peregrinibacteria bacterium]|jgi:hypothetical protein|nr:hypothetical protein [Candidatus Peregrinibacteria bacterium]
MQIPYIKYVETLVVGRMSADSIHDNLITLGLEFPIPGIQQVYDYFYKKQAKYFTTSTEEISPDWLKRWDIERMYGHMFNFPVDTVEGIKGSLAIMNDSLMYRLITSMALANITDEDIELIVNGKYNMQYSSDDVQCFLKYFFNVAEWGIQEKREYVNQTKDPGLKRFYKIALDGDKDYLLWKLGAAPEKSFDTMLKDMMTDSYYNFKERAKSDPDLAQKWGSLAVKLTDRLDKLDKDTDKKKDIFEEITFKIKGIVGNAESSSSIPHMSEINNDTALTKDKEA